MPDMRVCHQKIVVPDFRVRTSAFRSPMDIDVLAKDVVISDRQKRFLAFEFQVLRLESDGSKREELIVHADRRGTLDNHVRLESAARGDLNPGSDATIRTDESIGCDSGLGTHDSRWMNHAIYGCCPIEESRVASAASS